MIHQQCLSPGWNQQHLVVSGQEQATIVGSLPGVHNNWCFSGQKQKNVGYLLGANKNVQFLAKNRQRFLINDLESTTIAGSWQSTNHYRWFLAKTQQQWLVHGQEPPTVGFRPKNQQVLVPAHRMS